MKALRRILILGALAAAVSAAAAGLKTRNVLLVTIDGLRWQEVFRGADEAFVDKDHGGVGEREQPALREKYLAGDPAARRATLMPFLWTRIATTGQIIGNRDRGSEAAAANAAWISYPGYNELLTGRPDPALVSNFPLPNPNVSVLEWLDGRRGTAGRVVACVTWQVFPAILNAGRSRFPLWVSGNASRLDRVSPELAEIQRWMDDITPKSRDEHFDAFAYRAALDLIDTHRPRVLYVAFGEPDTWAHGRRYDRYLDSTQRCDRFIRTIWEKLQSMSQYRGKTTLILTTDHGRGVTPQDWTSHGRAVPGSGQTWMAVMGPDTPALGERQGGEPVAQAQVAATVAALLGEDFSRAAPGSAPPLPGVLPATGTRR